MLEKAKRFLQAARTRPQAGNRGRGRNRPGPNTSNRNNRRQQLIAHLHQALEDEDTKAPEVGHILAALGAEIEDEDEYLPVGEEEGEAYASTSQDF